MGRSVRDTGARGDGQVDDAPAIQRALDSGPSLVLVPAGTYRIGRTLRIGSGRRLAVHPHARLVHADGAGVDHHSFLLANAQPGQDRDIEVSGGIWDGNCRANPRGPDAPTSFTGVSVNFIGVRGLKLSGMTFVDAESYYLRLGEVRNFTVEHITFLATKLRPNQDGVHLGGFCEQGIIRHIRGQGVGVPSDDLVALNADDACQRAQNLDLKCGPIRDLVVHDLEAHSCHTFVRLLSTVSEIDGIDIERVRGGCNVAAINIDACRKCRVQVADPREAAYIGGLGATGRVRASDFVVHKSSPNSSALIDLESNVQDMVIEAFQRQEEKDAAPGAPTVLARYVSRQELQIEGLTPAQVAAVRRDKLAHASVGPMAAGPGGATQRIALRLERDGAFELAGGGFSRLVAHRD